MICDVVLPQLGMGMSEGSIAQWLVIEGAEVRRDQSIAIIETEKVATELPAPYSGFVHLVAAAGEAKLPVETLIARIADDRADYEQIGASNGGSKALAALPAETALARALKEARPAGRIRASGLAKAVARKNDIDVADLRGSGPSGRIIRKDVDAEIARLEAATKVEPSASCAARKWPSARRAPEMPRGTRAGGEKARLAITGVRKLIAERMVAASTHAAQTFSFFEIDVTGLAAWRKRLLARQDELGGRISLTAIYAKALAVACRRVPICNATVEGDEIVVWENVNIGIAVALPGRNEFDSSLIVPVVRDVGGKGVVEINEDIRQIVGKAREGRLAPDDTSGATITMSSTDGFMSPGTWMVSTPLLNLPQVINFQPGSLVDRPLVVDGAIAIRTVLPAGLVFDHRAMDGAPVAKFIRALCELLQEPESMLL